MTAMIGSILAALTIACPIPASTFATPVPASGRAVAGEELGSLGPFILDGHAIDLTSADPRFPALAIRPGVSASGACGHAIEAPSGWNADDPRIAATKIDLRPVKQAIMPGRGATEAAAINASPVLGTLIPGASWPARDEAGRQFFIGAMHGPGARGATTLVAFAAKPGRVPAVTLATLRFHVDELAITPPLHNSRHVLNLESRDATRWRRVSLWIPPEALRTMAAKVSVETD
jgi:hypothetical protein